MAKWYTDDPDSTQISEPDHRLRKKIVEALEEHTQEMEGYSYFGSNPGISEDDYEDAAESIMTKLNLWEVKDGEQTSIA